MAPMATPQLLTTTMIYVHDRDRELIRCRALLDTCATANFIAASTVTRLNLPIMKQATPISGIGDLTTTSPGMTRIIVQSRQGGFRKHLTCLIVPVISERIPSEPFPRHLIKIPSNITLADPDFHLPRPIDILIGAGATLSSFSVGQIDLTRDKCDLYLQKTLLGWVIGGSSSVASRHKAICQLTNLERQVARFWEVEEIEPSDSMQHQGGECEAYFVKTTKRNADGRYTVRLPFHDRRRQLGQSRESALRRLIALERKLSANAALKKEYTESINDYLRSGHMSRVDIPDECGYYMPHHAVIKETSNTTKVRVVFDASAATSNGISLNDLLMIGPSVQNKLITHILKLRTHRYVLIADIEKMYRQVWLHEDDRCYQSILWRVNGRIETFQLNTVTFGVSSAPFLATRTLVQLAEDERDAYPRAARVILEDFYVDDMLSGANTIGEARAIRDETIALLKCGGFRIRQWASNDERIIDDLDSNMVHKNFTMNADHFLKTLGISWDARDDRFYYTIRTIQHATKWTKCSILSEIARIFDPIGLLGPIVLCAKTLMQRVWKCKLHWDESVPQDIFTDWVAFAQQLAILDRISFDRKIFIDRHRNIQLHGFCDASTHGYGACIYVRSRAENGDTCVRLFCSKSRVAPLRTVTIPKLELCGARLLAQLYDEVKGAISTEPVETILWCDSTVVLNWIRMEPHALKVFVANRVAEIQRLTATSSWRHIRSEENPADALSRGQFPREFTQNTIWRTGPDWLRENADKWPISITQAIAVPEVKQNASFIVQTNETDFVSKYASYSKLLRVMAYCLRFRPNARREGSLVASEINEAETRILKFVQSKRFAEILSKADEGKLRSVGRIANLNLP